MKQSATAATLFHLLLITLNVHADGPDCQFVISDDTSTSGHESCPADTPLSCSVNTQDSCCIEATNGLFLQTQFWDYNPATGPDDVWTIHGLWSDKCRGGFNQFCNPSWQIQDVTGILQDLGLNDLLSTMQTNWKNQGHSDEDLWEHEFNKHGTCMSTVNPSCYGSDAPKYQYVGDFFNSAVNLWQALPSYEALSKANILPSTDKTWTVAEFKAALTGQVDGHDIYLGCDRNNAVNEIWYFYRLKGSVASGQFEPTDAITRSTCQDGFKYLPKGSGGGGGGGGRGNTTRGYLNVEGQTGCMISDGTWYVSGTCATFSVTETVGGVSVESSKGDCNVVDGTFRCGSWVSPGDFILDNGFLSYCGETKWSSDKVASGTSRIPVHSGSGTVTFQLKFGS